MQERPQYRDLSGLATAVRVALVAFLLATAFSAWSSWLQLDLLQRANAGAAITEMEAESNDRRERASGVIFLLIYIVTAILFLRWTYLAKQNAQALGATGMEFTPGWSVGYFFIPIMHLWKPYQAMRETFHASSPEHDEDWMDAQSPAVLGVWWTLWIVSVVLGQAALRLSLRTDSVDQLLTTTRVQLISSLVEFALGVVAIVLVSTLTAWQDEKNWKLVSDRA